MFHLPQIQKPLILTLRLSNLQLKILQAGWLRDGTWPEGAIAPAWDDQPQQSQSQQAYNAQLRQQQQSAPRVNEFASGIPPGYTPSSGDQDQSGAQSQMEQFGRGMQGQGQPYPYSEPTPPPGDPQRPSPPPVLSTALGVGDDDMDDDDDEGDDGEEVEGDELLRFHPGDSRHEGG